MRGIRRARLGLLKDAPAFRLLFLATLASSIGTWLAFVALVIDVGGRTDDANWVSALLIVEFLPIIVIGFFAGRLIDRVSRRWILVVSDAVRAGVFFALPFTTSALQIILLALAAGIATSLFRPAVYAGLPNLVSDRDLPEANGILQTADNLTWTIGSVVGGALVAATSPDVAYIVNGVSFAASAVLVAWSIVMLANAGVDVSEYFLATEVFNGGDFGYGLLVGATGLGLVAGSLFGGSWVSQRGLAVPYAVSIALMALGFGAAAVAPNVWVAALVVIAAGAGNGVAVVTNALLVQRGAPDRLRGRAFTVVMSVGYGVLGLGMVVAGPLTNAIGARAVWGISAGLTALGALVGLVLVRGVTPETRPGDALPASD